MIRIISTLLLPSFIKNLSFRRRACLTGLNPQRWPRPVWGSLLAVLLLAQISARKQPKQPDAPLDATAMLNFSRYGSGYLVWERSKDGSWQIWAKQLDGTKEDRLVPAEPGRDHFCPKVSPDGSLLAYLSYPAGEHPYRSSPKQPAALWLMNLRTGSRTRLAPEAHSYYEDRAVVWRSSKRLCFINGAGETIEINLSAKTQRRVLDYHEKDFGYLPSPDLRHATSGAPEFATVNEQGTMTHQKLQEGCQPYFTSDSLWGFWMSGSGGPVSAMFLPTRQIHQIIERRDPRLPKERTYVYFPMISPCMRLLAYAASSGEHDHFQADYNIFLALVNPANLRMIGSPVRYTKSDGCDRFPDVYRRELPLGTHFVEGETTLKFDPAEGKGAYEFDFGDGGSARGRSARHTFKKPGDYWVTATGTGKNRQKLRGFVHVEPVTPPTVLQVQRRGPKDLLVHFDKAVTISSATARIGDGPLLAPELTAERHGMLIHLPDNLPTRSSLTLDGVRGTAQQPDTMPRSAFSIEGPAWPATDKGLLFSWRDAFASSVSGSSTEGHLLPQGRAFWNEHGALQLRGGWGDADANGRRLSEAIRSSGAFSFEAVLTSEPGATEMKQSVILALADRKGVPNLLLTQTDKDLALELRCAGARDGETQVVTDFAGLDAGESHHVLVSFQDGEVTVFFDGRARRAKPGQLGGLFKWKPHGLRIGALPDGSRPWRGTVERVAAYDRAFTDDEAEAHARSSRQAADFRHTPREWNVVAELVESTPAPTLQDIQPYKDALVTQLYQVRKSLGGDGALPDQIVVTQWAWLGGNAMPAQSLKTGDRVKLRLHEHEAHPELKPLVTRDSLVQGIGLPVFHDVSAWDHPLSKE